jgi:2-phospho-L-lactate guanylyltransferase (CobY/MobA/RfbA family)
MSFLLIPIAPLSRTKSRLRDCFSKEQLKELTIAMFKDLGQTLSSVKCYEEKIVYCNGSEILELAADFGLIGIKEELTEPRKSFDEVISDLNTIAIQKFNAQKTVFTFLDTILISSENFLEIHSLIEKNQLVVCPAIHSAGISVLGRNPPEIIPTYFSDPNLPSFVALLKNAKQIGLEKIAIYDSFRAGFDIDIKHDLLLAYQYLKILNLKEKETYKYLKHNLKLTLRKVNVNNNRNFKITKKQQSKFK